MDKPADTDEMWQWAEKLTTKGSDGNIERLGMLLPSWTWSRFAWIVNFGGKLWDTKANEPTPQDPGVLEALNDLVVQVKKFGVDNLDRWSTSIGSQSGEQSPYLAGKMVMQLDGDWTGQTIFDFHPDWGVDKDYGIIEPPKPPASKQHGDSSIALWSWPWVVPAGTKNPDWSWELLRFYLSPEYQLNVHGKFKELVLRKSMNGDARQWWPAAKKGKEALSGSRAITAVMPMNSVASEYINLLGEAFDKILHLTETPEQSMERVKTETMDKMKTS
jgi:ABC-type glycerol-3-phosphate transport system substrate-binding protein